MVETHVDIHKRLHKRLDELVADWITHTDSLPTKCTVMDLIEWSYSQTKEPSEIKNEIY